MIVVVCCYCLFHHSLCNRFRSIVETKPLTADGGVDVAGVTNVESNGIEEVEYDFYFDGISQLHKRAVKWEMERL